jgi:hypothetical protein
MARLALYLFRYRSPVTGKWMRARYVAEREVIAERYKEWEITGPPEIRDVDIFEYKFATAFARLRIAVGAFNSPRVIGARWRGVSRDRRSARPPT